MNVILFDSLFNSATPTAMLDRRQCNLDETCSGLHGLPRDKIIMRNLESGNVQRHPFQMILHPRCESVVNLGAAVEEEEFSRKWLRRHPVLSVVVALPGSALEHIAVDIVKVDHFKRTRMANLLDPDCARLMLTDNLEVVAKLDILDNRRSVLIAQCE